jgi:hypothetical protein
VLVPAQAKVAIFDGRGNSLSWGGMAIDAGADLDRGDQASLEFTPAYSSPVRVDAVLRNRSGLEFLTATNSQAEQNARLQPQLSTPIS